MVTLDQQSYWWLNTIQNEDCRKGLKQLPDECIDCVITSPPYWVPKNMGQENEIGFEKFVGFYVTHLCDVFKEVKRVLKNDGFMFINIGDCYNADMELNQIPEGFAICMKADKWKLRREFIRIYKNQAEKVYLFSKSDNYLLNTELPSVWIIKEEQRFIKWPDQLAEIMVKACPEQGVILDPFAGTGTVCRVARKLNRKFIGFEIDKDLVTAFYGN